MNVSKRIPLAVKRVGCVFVQGILLACTRAAAFARFGDVIVHFDDVTGAVIGYLAGQSRKAVIVCHFVKKSC